MEETRKLLAKLGGQTLTLEFAQPLHSLPTELAAMHGALREGGRKICLAIQEPSQISRALRLCEEIGLQPCEIETARPELEDVFLRLIEEGRSRA